MALATSTLTTIRQKVRRLTRSPSLQQLSDGDLDQYINTFIAYDFPEHLRLFSLRTTLTFYTQPGVDVYETSTDPKNALFDFKNIYIAIHQPVFIAGVPASFTQWRDVFFGQWPQTAQVQKTTFTGNGGMGPFTGILNTFPQAPFNTGPNSGAILQNSVVFSILDVNNKSMVLIDYPSLVNPTIGYLAEPNSAPTNIVNNGTINYETGAFTAVTFPSNTLNSTSNFLIAEYVMYIPGLPISMLYYDNQFTLRPVPDKTYAVQVEADIRPTQLLATDQNPQINQWWQFISYGCAKKIFEDRMDLDSVQMIMPEFKNQMNFVNRTSLTQQANERTTTIYTEGKSYGWGWYNNSNFPF